MNLGPPRRNCGNYAMTWLSPPWGLPRFRGGPSSIWRTPPPATGPAIPRC
ncbi:uncharacterized protein AruCF_3973 [Achromobacter ruhlandii]|nr:uncharacterized protein AruCF_3973 [Achromobacter ruhlandii]